jgi:hypothetical protein
MRPCLCALLLVCACPEIEPPAPPPEPVPSWQLSVPVPGIRVLTDVQILSPTSAYAVGSAGAILHWDGTTWTALDSGTAVDLERVSGVVEDEVEHLLVVGALGTVLYRGASGTFELLPSGTTARLFGCVLARSDDGFIVGESGTILRFDGTRLVSQAAESAQPVDTPSSGRVYFPIPEHLKAVDIAGGRVFAVGSGGAIYSSDGDRTCRQDCWLREISGTVRPLANVHNRAGAWAPTTDGVLLSRDGDPDPNQPTRANWDDDAVRAPAPVFLQDMVFEGSLFTVGLAEDIFELSDEGWLLTRVALAAELRAIDGTFVPPDPEVEGDEGHRLVFVVGGGGRIARGPAFLSEPGETPLVTRRADDDFRR